MERGARATGEFSADGLRGISNVCLSVPSIVGHRGVEGLLPVPMNATEEAGLQSSAEAIQHVVRTLGF